MSSGFPEKNLAYKVKHALKHPERVVPHAQRAARNVFLRRQAGGDFSLYYRKVIAATTAANGADQAIGSYSHDHWLQTGEMQFEYLISHGLLPEHRVLDIGCGNLRLGWRLIEFLDEGNYVGLDLSPEILFAAQQVVVQNKLQANRPYLEVIDGTSLDFLPTGTFDVAHAHSVFSHTPLDVFEAYVRQVRDLLTASGFFDFTFIEGEREYEFVGEDFRYPAATLLNVAERNGMTGARATDWDYPQAKIRLRLP